MRRRPVWLAAFGLLSFAASSRGVRYGATVADAKEPPAPRRYQVLKNGQLVLEVVDVPGPLVSTAILPPGMQPVQHPFLTATARAAFEESALREILDRSTTFDDFLRRLTEGGYVVRPQ